MSEEPTGEACGGSAPTVRLSTYSVAASAGGSLTERVAWLRSRLDELGYRQPLDVESLALVERLLADLVHTTDSLRRTKLDLAKSALDSFLFYRNVFWLYGCLCNYLPCIFSLSKESDGARYSGYAD